MRHFYDDCVLLSHVIDKFRRVSLLELVLKAETLLQEHPAWPCVNALQKFSLLLQRYTTHMVFTKKWIRRFYVMQNGHLYYCDGKNEYPDSREGSVSFANSNPAPDGRYCVNLRGECDGGRLRSAFGTCRLTPFFQAARSSPAASSWTERHLRSKLNLSSLLATK